MSLDPNALKDIVESSGVRHRENAHSYIFDCPKCNKGDKLWMFKDSGQFICWYCAEIEDYRGSAEWALRDLLGLPLDVLRNKLYGSDTAGPLVLEAFDYTCFWADKEDLPPDNAPLMEVEWPWNSYPIEAMQSRRGQTYLYERGVTDSVAKEHGLRYWPEQQRVLFPVVMDGRLLGHQARTIHAGRQPKILTSEGLRRDRALMFYDTIAPGAQSVIIVEGPVDAIKCALCGPHVATMGKAVTRPQIEMIRSLNIPRVYIGLDPDADAEASRLVQEFSDRETYLLLPPPHREDLGDCTFEEVLTAFRAAPKITPGHLVCEFPFPEDLFT